MIQQRQVSLQALDEIAPNTQSLCVAASGNEFSLITLKLEVIQSMSFQAQVDCGASNDFVRRQSLDKKRARIC